MFLAPYSKVFVLSCEGSTLLNLPLIARKLNSGKMIKIEQHGLIYYVLIALTKSHKACLGSKKQLHFAI